MRQPVGVAECVERPPLVLESESEPRGFESGARGFEPWSSQTHDFKIIKIAQGHGVSELVSQ